MVIGKSNKKGQEMSVSTLVLIVIGIVVLVLVILGFTFGWQNLWNKINLFQGGSVQDVVSACKIAATSDATVSYCNEFKKVTIDGATQYINCQDSHITGLDKQLTCTGDPVKDEFVALAKQGSDLSVTSGNNAIRVNGQLSTLTCTEDPLKGVLVDGTSCAVGTTQYKVGNIPAAKVCCSAK